ncbi:unnamed protein product, partial [Ectocarpus sp. 12 AP-2014]
GAIDAANAGNGTVNITGALTYNGTIGTGTKVAAVAFNAGGNAVAIGKAITSAAITINAADTITSGGLITGNVTFNANGKIISNAGIIGNVDFNDNDASIELADNQVLTGDADSAGGANGTLKFLGNGQVTGTIGANQALTKVIASGAGTVQLANGTSKAATFETNHANAIIEVAAGGLGKLQGNVDATVNGGQLKFLGDGEVTGTIGVTNPLTQITASGPNGTALVLRNITNTGILELSSGADVTLENNTTIDKLNIVDVNSHVNIAD